MAADPGAAWGVCPRCGGRHGTEQQEQACAARTAASAFDRAVELADQIEQNWNDPAVYEWGYQWEHLGDAERDFRVLIAGLREIQTFFQNQGLGMVQG